jgi:membrane-associated protease RseP (regulator of RpoE activity)
MAEEVREIKAKAIGEMEKLVQQAFWPMYPLLFDIVQPIIRPTLEGYSLILTQVELAAWVGSLLTFLNILPVWELDGGHISRAVFGARGHRILAKYFAACFITSSPTSSSTSDMKRNVGQRHRLVTRADLLLYK